MGYCNLKILDLWASSAVLWLRRIAVLEPMGLAPRTMLFAEK